MTDVDVDDDDFAFDTDESVDDFEWMLVSFGVALDSDGRSELFVDAVELMVFDANVDVPDEYGSIVLFVE